MLGPKKISNPTEASLPITDLDCLEKFAVSIKAQLGDLVTHIQHLRSKFSLTNPPQHKPPSREEQIEIMAEHLSKKWRALDRKKAIKKNWERIQKLGIKIEQIP